MLAVLEEGLAAAGARLTYSSFRHHRVAPVYIGAESATGWRFGLLIYPFRTTRRETQNRPDGERRTQIRFGDPVREREQENPLALDPAGVDVTLVLAIDPEEQFIVGLDPLLYADLPMGISVYYRDSHVEAASETGWAVWERQRKGGKRRDSPEGLETQVGFRPDRLLDYARFETRASALGLSPDLRGRLAEQFARPDDEPHNLEVFFGLDATTILGIIDRNFRLGIAVRGGVAEHHLGAELDASPGVVRVEEIDADGEPDFRIGAETGSSYTIECKTASKERYADGDFKVEVQKTRDSKVGRKYRFDQFDIIAACLFSATGFWEFRYRWARDLRPWKEDATRIGPMQRIGHDWAQSIDELLAD